MSATVENANPYLVRFQQLLTQSALVARRYVEAETAATPISTTARERAQNVLSYTLNAAEAWPATRELLLALAPRMELAGYRTEWLPYLADGVAQSQRLDDQGAAAALHFHCGYLYRLISNYAQAQTHLNASATHYAALGDAEGQARALNQLAYLAWQQHRYEDAERLAHAALTTVGEMALEKAVSLSALGLVANDRSRYTEAENYHRAALSIRTSHAAHKEMAWSLQNIGLALSEQGQHALAIDYYQQALTLLARVYDPAHRAIIQMNLSTAYYVQGESTQALEIILVAEQNLRQLSDQFNLAKLLTIKGLCYLALRQPALATPTFQASADLFWQLNDLSWYLNAYDGVGISYLEQEHYEEAYTIFRSIAEQLPQIAGTPAYKYLATTITTQLEQAKGKQVVQGKSVYFSTKSRHNVQPA
jgi:tetratricopeptide (TPR) repeat protein